MSSTAASGTGTNMFLGGASHTSTSSSNPSTGLFSFDTSARTPTARAIAPMRTGNSISKPAETPVSKPAGNMASTGTGGVASAAADKFLSAMKGYYNTDYLSDVLIVCDGEVFKVHGLVLSASSKYFATVLSGGWKESAEKKIVIEDFDPSIVDAMLRFMYSFDYSNTCGTSSMVYDAQVYQIADKYDVPTLKEHATGKFRAAIEAGWNMDDFPVAVSVVYESTPQEDKGLRSIVIDICCKHVLELIAKPGFDELMRKTPDFAADMVPAVVKK